jgi:hypothetical protein
MGKLLVVGLLAASVILGGMTFRRYTSSEKLVRAVAADLDTRGRSMDGEECVGWVLEWGRSCPALKIVCDEAIRPLVKTCLQARDRTDYCRSLGPKLDTHFSFERCRLRGYTRRDHGCAEAYLEVVDHCLAPTRGNGRAP